MLLSVKNPEAFETAVKDFISNLPEKERLEMGECISSIDFNNMFIRFNVYPGKMSAMVKSISEDFEKSEGKFSEIKIRENCVETRIKPPADLLQHLDYNHACECINEMVAIATSRAINVNAQYSF